MGTYPTSPRAAFLAWCQAHAPVFTINATAIGLTAAQVTAFKALITNAAAAADDQEASKQAAKSATTKATNIFADLRSEASDLVRIIRTFAVTRDDPNVYVLAEIPPPGSPSPVPPPAMPTDLTVTLDGSSGDLALSWKASNPVGASGTSYIVRRKLPGESTFAFVGVTGTKRFVDGTFSAGPDSVQYTVQGQRSDSTGPLSAIFTVNFGQAGPGLSISSVSSGPTKLAA